MARKRAVKVCEACHRRKTKCDTDATKGPCSKCKELGDKCTIRIRKPYSGRRGPSAPRCLSVTSCNEEQDFENQRSVPFLDQTKIVASAIPQPVSKTTPIFVGEGGYSVILDAMGDVKQRHFYVPAAAEKVLAPEDLEYLKIKGCFLLPAESKELIRAYFQFVHASFPVIDGPLFLRDYASGGLNRVNLLLLWSMFSIAASYVPGLSSSVVKESFVQRAKLLYDLSRENDKVVLVQSALLISFWFADAEDVMQSWYWSGIAFGIAQTLGLHRDLKADTTQAAFPQRGLWRNIWRCCMIRDVWLASGMGRPLRINKADCSCPLPTDSDPTFQDIIFHGEALYTLAESAGFAKMWQSLATVSDVLREIVSVKEKQSSSWTKSHEARLGRQDESESTLLLVLVSRHLKLHQEAALIAIYRLAGDEQKMKTATSRTTSVLEAFLADGTTTYVSPTSIPLIVPAMLMHLVALKSRNPDARKSGHDKLEVFSQFLTAIEANYPAASIVNRLFATAQDSMAKQNSAMLHGDQSNADIVGQPASSWDSVSQFDRSQETDPLISFPESGLSVWSDYKMPWNVPQ